MIGWALDHHDRLYVHVARLNFELKNDLSKAWYERDAEASNASLRLASLKLHLDFWFLAFKCNQSPRPDKGQSGAAALRD